MIGRTTRWKSGSDWISVSLDLISGRLRPESWGGGFEGLRHLSGYTAACLHALCLMPRDELC